MSTELETAAADSVAHLFKPRRKFQPPPGATCANCDAPLQGSYCYDCGQQADTHKRSILHLIWEAIEGLFHLDGRLSRTLPALFFRPGGLAKDYMEGRIARHVPPFRTFLVALLLFIFAAEHAIHEATKLQEEKAHAHEALLATPAGRAKLSLEKRIDAVKDRDETLREAAQERADDLKDPDEKPERVEATYARVIAKAQAKYQKDLVKADLLAKGESASLEGVGLIGSETARANTLKALDATEDKAEASGGHNDAKWLRDGIRKAVANPEYYLSVMFAWGHRLAVLLLPIVGLSLAAVYVTKRKFYIYDHLLVAMNLLSFAFLTNAVGLMLTQPWQLGWFSLVAFWTPINMFQTLRGAYGSSIMGAVIKTAIVWFATVFAFSFMLICLMIFALGQL